MIAKPAETVRCAVYTRKSTEEGLDQDFNSLDAQRASAESYIESQGWVCLPHRYDDGGFTGGNIERPGLTKLMADIEAGAVDCVIVNKVDRLSRSLMDFSRLMSVFEKHGVSFVSVTQHFNTAHSMGRLMLNVLLSFAQFEREMISERTRDKIAAARKKGKWAGGRPVLGYDLESRPGGNRLAVNPGEAERVRAIFDLYLDSPGGLMPVVRECANRGWVTKEWTTKAGKPMGGKTLDKNALHALLTNPVYLGKVKHHDDLYEGEHEAIVDGEVFELVRRTLALNGRTGGSLVRNTHHALLKGLIRCKACSCTMGHHFASKSKTSGTVRYRYYVCLKAQKQGWDACPAPSLPAGEIEAFVVSQLKRALSGDDAIDAVVKHATTLLAADHPDLVFDPDEAVGAVESFDPVWDSMTHRERESLVRALVERVEYDAECESIAVTFKEGAGVTSKEGAAS